MPLGAAASYILREAIAMFATPRGRARLISGLLLLMAAFAAGVWSGIPRTRAAEEADAKLNALLKERLEVLQEVVNRTKILHSTGGANIVEVCDANLAVLNAELDMSSTDEARAKVLGTMISVAKDKEQYLVRLQNAGELDSRDVLKAAASRLSHEIALERLRMETK